MHETPADVRGSVALPPGGNAAAAAPPVVADVWSRTEPKYRVRAAVLLVVNLLLFCGLCAFTHWLHRAQLFEFTWDSYFAPMNFLTSQSPNLNDFILYPIDVTKVPTHAFVLGLLVAAIVAVPILVSILYRFPAALPFIAAVFVFAHMPWMAVTLTASCILASVPPFRMRFRFGSALVGLMPVLLYLYLATRGGTDLLDQASPAQRALLAAPWILAVLAACLMLGIVLLISRAVNYRPGAVAPVLAVMFATPVALFFTKVGGDELWYPILENEYGPRSQRFEPSRDARPIVRGLGQRIFSDPELYDRYAADLMDAAQGRPNPLRRLVLQQMQIEFLSERAAAHEALRRFRQVDFPDSRYAPAVLYLNARIMDMRLDERAFDLATPRRDLYTDFPHVQSESLWRELFDRYPHSQLAAVAGLRLAQLHLRAGRIVQALDTLQATIQISAPRAERGPASAPGGGSPLNPIPAEETLDFDPRPYLREARRLEELIRLNGADPTHGSAPLRALACLDPRRPGFAAQLRELALRYPDALLADNLRVLLAGNAPGSADRVAQLGRLARELPSDSDALPEALFRLAEIELAATVDGEKRTLGLTRLRGIAEQYPQSFWASQALDLLERMVPARAELAAG